MAEIISFTRGVPPAESFPDEELISCMERVIRTKSAVVLQYGTGAGYKPLRDYIASVNDVSSDRVIIGQGSLQLLDHLCRATIQKGNGVFVEQPTYDRTLTLFKRAGASLTGFRLEDGQMDITQVKAKLKNGNIPKYCYLITDFQNPSGAVMGLENRKELASLAEQFGFQIIEDSPYRHLRYKGEHIPRILDIAPDRTIFMSSFSKKISPGLRTGYMILPEEDAELIARFATDTYISPSYLDQAVVLDYAEQGFLKNQTDRLIKLFHLRLKTILNALELNLTGMGTWIKPQGGFYVGLNLNKDIPPIDIDMGLSNGLMLSDGRGFFLDGGERFLRLPFCALHENEISEGIMRLKRMIQNSIIH